MEFHFNYGDKVIVVSGRYKGIIGEYDDDDYVSGGHLRMIIVPHNSDRDIPAVKPEHVRLYTKETHALFLGGNKKSIQVLFGAKTEGG